jgi:peptidoglycan/xylan/chitin deacetylase (PgdA/CDA1 family)
MGQFVISLDFEKFWGLRDKRSIKEYERNLENVDAVVLELLKLFSEEKIHATWATVGMLAFKSKRDLLEQIPKRYPPYCDNNLSPYHYIVESELDPIYHFAPLIIENIISTKNQELASHTFSHYYCLEKGQTEDYFNMDLKMNIEIVRKKFGVKMSSIVFPRNQVNKTYLGTLVENNIRCFRGNESNWINNLDMKFFLKRGFRLLDSYLNLTGSNTYDLNKIGEKLPHNIPSSYFLRPVRAKKSLLKFLKLRRIKGQMTYAAKNDKVFHLWWHPHNFGNDIHANLLFLKDIISHFRILERRFNMESLSMSEISKRISERTN